MLAGSCNCGAVSFEVTCKATDIYMCHCSICRRSTGGAGVAVLVVPNADFRWMGGEDHIGYWKKPDADWEAWFCKTCGSSLPGRNDPTRMFVPVGLITSDTTDLRIAHHIWVDSRASWDEIAGPAKQHPRGFGA